MFIVFVQTFHYHTSENVVELLAFICALFAITFVGFFDDMLIRHDKEASFGLHQWQKPLLTVFAAVPLMVVNAGQTEMYIPIVGVMDVGLLYPLLFIPIGVIGASNMVNLLGGFNGLETGLGLLYLGNLTLYAFVVGSDVAALIGFITCASLLAFLAFNFSPAKIFPGDSLTYLLGGVLASMAILGNIEKAALIVSIPFFIEFMLKMRGKLKKQSYGYYKDGYVKSFYKKVYSIPHFFTRSGRFTEEQVVVFVWCIQLVFCLMVWVV
jgi:UDP-N-acetylglucosamine--dolichyl-phosphate N-acetylglucosaminephosphotransferase